ncbi:MAG: 2-succinylbenzoate--CoA ligase [Cyanobacteria bacterium P01_F01_bin.4]
MTCEPIFADEYKSCCILPMGELPNLKRAWGARRKSPWIVGCPADTFAAVVEQRIEQIARLDRARPLVLIAESDPIVFLACFWAGLLQGCDLALTNPHWGQREWQQVFSLLTPDLCWGEPAIPRPAPQTSLAPYPEPRILIPTGGTSGQVRFAIHTWATLSAAVHGFLDYFGGECIHAYCVLPLYHVSGLMQALRTWFSGGQLVVQPFKSLRQGDRQIQPAPAWFISLVPTQLHRLLSADTANHSTDFTTWLSQFQAILLGGAPAWPPLLAQARKQQLPIALTYGMTETAAQIATLKPQDFLKGLQSSGQVLPHARVTIQPEMDMAAIGQPLPANQVGRICIQTESLMLGYLPSSEADFAAEQSLRTQFYPDDLGYLDPQGYLHIVGRTSHKIITGGENVFPTEVEAALWATQQVKDVCVIGLPDPDWGQIVTAVYVPAHDQVTAQTLKAALRKKLSAYKHPKQWMATATLPRNAQGKVNRQALLEQVSSSNGLGLLKKH